MTQRQRSHWESASFCGRLTYSFIGPLLKLGTTKDLTDRDLPELATHDQIQAITDRLESQWNKQVAAGTNNLWLALYHAETWSFWFAGLMCLGESATRIGQPVMLGFFLEWLTSNQVHDLAQGLWLSLGLSLLAFLQIYIHHLLYFYTMRGGWNARLSCTSLIHRKLLRVHSGAMGGGTTDSTGGGDDGGSPGNTAGKSDGNIVNLVSNDVFRFDSFFPTLHFGWSGPLDFIVCFLLIADKVGWAAAVAGVSFILLTLPIQLILGQRLSGIRRRTAASTDARVQRTSEILDGILTVKASVWEHSFDNEISMLRETERSSIFRSMLIKAFNAGVHFCTPYLATLCIFIAYWSQGNVLSVSVVFSTMSLVHVLRLSLGKNLGFFIERLPEAKVSIARITAFLLLKEKKTTGTMETAEPTGTIEPTEQPTEQPTKPTEKKSILQMKNVTFAWGCPPSSPYIPVVKQLTLSAQPGDLVVITGPTGCGKTALLKGIAGELDQVDTTTAGTCVVKGSIAVVNQIPWILSGSLKSNVLWSALPNAMPSNENDPSCDNDGAQSIKRFQTVLQRCGLDTDVEQWKDGVETLIGEKGVNLSGGQRARVSLARALYADKDIVLLDGVLSAVDPTVAASLLNNVILPMCRQENKICVVATHSVDLCRPHANVFVQMDADGCIKETTIMKTKVEVPGVKKIVEDVTEPIRKETVPTTVETKQSTADAAAAPTNIILKEEKTVGTVKCATYLAYLNSAGYAVSLVVLLLFIGGQTCALLADYSLKEWSDGTSEEQRDLSSRPHFQSFVIFTAVTSVVAVLRSIFFYYVGLRAATVIHGTALRGVVNSPMSYFTSNPLGRILNKFSSDLGQMDEQLPSDMHNCLTSMFLCLGSVILSIYAIPWMIVPIVPLAFIMAWVRSYFLHSSRSLKRCEAISKSPVFVAFSTNMRGRSTIRAYDRVQYATNNFEHILAANGRAWFAWLNVNRWVGFRLDSITLVVLSAVVFIGALLGWSGAAPPPAVSGGTNATGTNATAVPSSAGISSVESVFTTVDHGLLAIAITYSIQMSGIFQYMIRLSAKVETQMIAVERLSHLARLHSEHDDHDGKIQGNATATQNKTEMTAVKDHKNIDGTFAPVGAIQLSNVSVKYRQNLPIILKNINLNLKAGNLIGVCGRTGSGKSSLMLGLLRLNIICNGDVIIDGTSTSKVSLKTLRRAIGVIPQTPTLFAGTLRYNIDPTRSRYSDEDIVQVLNAIGMRIHQKKEGLNYIVEENGRNLSVGEQQCISLARACLLKAKIYLLDECTANIDYATDQMIQNMLRTHPSFVNATVVIVAHRLSTIKDVNQIVVMDNGVVLETGSPQELLSDETSAYSKMMGDVDVRC